MSSSIRLATLNVLFGGEQRLPALVEIVRRMQPDVLVLQECIGWQEDDSTALADMAAAMGIEVSPRTTLLGVANPRPSGRQFNVALLSRIPILDQQTHTEGFTHCVVEAVLDHHGTPLVVLGAHLVSRDEQVRLQETERLIARIDRETLASGYCALLGDLNALSRHDPYDDTLDAKLLACGIHKYGHPPQFAELDRLLAAGWVDALHTEPRSAAWVTASRGGNGHTVDTRSDYVLLSPPLAKGIERTGIVDVGDASDHHAVMATVRIG